VTSPLRAGIIGGGWIARVHVPMLDRAEGVELVAACDTAIERAEAIATPRGARAYDRWQDMLEGEALDAVWICTPPLHHRAPAEAALAAGIHVYLEKPIARTLEDAEAIAAAAAASRAVCAVGYQWHASELLERARSALAGQQVAMLVGRNYGPVAARPWFMDAELGGGQILERGSHHIDLQRALAGRITAVDAFASGVGLAQESAAASIDDGIVLLLHFENGAIGSVHSAWSKDGQPELYATDVVASDATITLDLGPGAFRISGRSGDLPLAGDHGDPMQRSIGGFLDAARSGQRDRVFCTPADALETLAVALACERALGTGRRVAV
jgi:myo-inositol 2-dehydrogenase / D-chiro-inositol 1-dehydrogenase